eukprot:COSAG04_NODE_10936_length_742_cov_1.878694_1_plen_80_part_10
MTGRLDAPPTTRCVQQRASSSRSTSGSGASASTASRSSPARLHTTPRADINETTILGGCESPTIPLVLTSVLSASLACAR